MDNQQHDEVSQPINLKKKLWIDITLGIVILAIPFSIWGNEKGVIIPLMLLGLLGLVILAIIIRHLHRKGKFKDQKFIGGLGIAALALVFTIIANNKNSGNGVQGKSFFGLSGSAKTSTEYTFEDKSFKRSRIFFDEFNKPTGTSFESGTYSFDGSNIQIIFSNGVTRTLKYITNESIPYIKDGSLELVLDDPSKRK